MQTPELINKKGVIVEHFNIRPHTSFMNRPKLRDMENFNAFMLLSRLCVSETIFVSLIIALYQFRKWLFLETCNCIL